LATDSAAAPGTCVDAQSSHSPSWKCACNSSAPGWRERGKELRRRLRFVGRGCVVFSKSPSLRIVAAGAEVSFNSFSRRLALLSCAKSPSSQSTVSDLRACIAAQLNPQERRRRRRNNCGCQGQRSRRIGGSGEKASLPSRRAHPQAPDLVPVVFPNGATVHRHRSTDATSIRGTRTSMPNWALPLFFAVCRARSRPPDQPEFSGLFQRRIRGRLEGGRGGESCE